MDQNAILAVIYTLMLIGILLAIHSIICDFIIAIKRDAKEYRAYQEERKLKALMREVYEEEMRERKILRIEREYKAFMKEVNEAEIGARRIHQKKRGK